MVLVQAQKRECRNPPRRLVKPQQSNGRTRTWNHLLASATTESHMSPTAKARGVGGGDTSIGRGCAHPNEAWCVKTKENGKLCWGERNEQQMLLVDRTCWTCHGRTYLTQGKYMYIYIFSCATFYTSPKVLLPHQHPATRDQDKQPRKSLRTPRALHT